MQALIFSRLITACGIMEMDQNHHQWVVWSSLWNADELNLQCRDGRKAVSVSYFEVSQIVPEWSTKASKHVNSDTAAKQNICLSQQLRFIYCYLWKQLFYMLFSWARVRFHISYWWIVIIPWDTSNERCYTIELTC